GNPIRAERLALLNVVAQNSSRQLHKVRLKRCAELSISRKPKRLCCKHGVLPLFLVKILYREISKSLPDEVALFLKHRSPTQRQVFPSGCIYQSMKRLPGFTIRVRDSKRIANYYHEH